MNPFFSPVQYTKEHEGSHETDGGRTWNTEREVRAREMMTIHLQVPSIVSLSSWIPFPLLSISCSVILVPTSKCTQIMRHGREKKERRRRRRRRERPRDKELPRASSSIFGWSFSFFCLPSLISIPFPDTFSVCVVWVNQSLHPFSSLIPSLSLKMWFLSSFELFSWCESVCFSKEFISCSRLNIFHQDFLEERETGRRKSSWYVVGKEGIRSRYFFLFFFPVKSHTTKWLQWWMNVCVIVFLEDKELMAETEIGSLRLWERRWYTRSCKTSLQISLLLLPNQL